MSITRQRQRRWPTKLQPASLTTISDDMESTTSTMRSHPHHLNEEGIHSSHPCRSHEQSQQHQPLQNIYESGSKIIELDVMSGLVLKQMFCYNVIRKYYIVFQGARLFIFLAEAAVDFIGFSQLEITRSKQLLTSLELQNPKKLVSSQKQWGYFIKVFTLLKIIQALSARVAENHRNVLYIQTLRCLSANRTDSA